MNFDRFRFAVARVIIAVWVLSLFVEQWFPFIREHSEIRYLVLIVAGWLFGPRVRFRRPEMPTLNGPEET